MSFETLTKDWSPQEINGADNKNKGLHKRARLTLALRANGAPAISSRLLAHRPEGIFVAPFEQGEIGPDLFKAACNMGLEGMVSKRADRPYRAGQDWVKVKNRNHPALDRVMDSF